MYNDSCVYVNTATDAGCIDAKQPAVDRELGMTLTQILIWIVIGAIAGLLAKAVIGGARIGLIGTIVVGILGALLGGWLFGLLGIHILSGFLGEVITALVGAIILLVILRAIRR